MKKYSVEMPIAGYVVIEVEAGNKNDAINKVLEKGFEDDEIMELEMFPKLVEGNICHAYCIEADVEEIKD